MFWAVIVDFLVVIFIFVPKVEKYALIYTIFWGFMTALVRILANIDIHFMGQVFNQYLWEVLCRLMTKKQKATL